MTDAVDFHEKLSLNFKNKYLAKRSFRKRLAVWERLIREVQIEPYSRSLDLGCGPGWMTKALSTVCDNVVAVDGSEGMIALANETVGPSSNKIVEFLRENIDPGLFSRWPSGHFNMIISSSVLEYIDGAEEILRKCFDSLATGGTLIISIPNRQSLFRLVEGTLFRHFGRPGYRGLIKNVWEKEFAVDILRAAGFKVEKVLFQGYIPVFSQLFFWLPERFQKPMMIVVAKKD